MRPRREEEPGRLPTCPGGKCPEGPGDGGMRPPPLDNGVHRHRGRARFVATPRRACSPPCERSGLRKHPDVGLEPVHNGDILKKDA